MTVVVVLPCVPLTATVSRPAQSAASASFRGTTGMPAARAASKLGMIRRNRRRHHHRAATLHVGRCVTLRHRNAQLDQVRRPARIVVAAADHHASAPGQERQGTHSGAANAHEVHRTRVVCCEKIHRNLLNLGQL